jgi:MOSC domain-containing protein YiiM
MDPVVAAAARKGLGLVGNANQGGSRQVTVISREAVDAAARELGRPVDPSVRRANVLVEGIDLKDSRGRILRMGELRLEVGGETRPCERMDAAIPGLKAALDPDWRAGLYGTVLEDAVVKVGDPVRWEDPASRL